MPGAPTPPVITIGFGWNASAAYLLNPIPSISQIATSPGRASYPDGFPPLTFVDEDAGGYAPAGQDMNGILFAATANIAALTGGQYATYNAAFAAANGGYALGAIVRMASQKGWWVNLSAGNANNPDTTALLNNGWAPVKAYGIATESGLTNANVTMGQEAACDIVVVSGTLSANVSLIFPPWTKQWLVINNTTGAFALTCRTQLGSGVVVPPGGAQNPTLVYGDGTNIQPVFSALDNIVLLRTSNASVVSNVTPAADSQLITPVLPSGWYRVKALLFFEAAGVTNPGIRAYVTANVSTDAIGFYSGSVNGATVRSQAQESLPFGNAFPAITTEVDDYIEIEGSIFLGSPGQIYVNWAQYTSSAQAAILLQGSSLAVSAVQG